MNDYIYRKFVKSRLQLKIRENLRNKLKKFEQRYNGDQVDNADRNHNKSWYIGSKGFSTKRGIYLQNYTHYLPTLDIIQTNARDKDISAGTFPSDHGKVIPLKNYSYSPLTTYKKKHNKINIAGMNPKGTFLHKTYPLNVNNLSNDQLKSLGAILLKNRYIANRIVGEQGQKASNANKNGDYTINQPRVDYGSPIYTSNSGPQTTQLYITTEFPTNAASTDSIYNYQNFEFSTSTNQPIYPTSIPNSVNIPVLNAGSQINFDSSPPYSVNYPTNMGLYGTGSHYSASSPSYNPPNQMNSAINQQSQGYSYGPSYSANPMNSISPVYSAPAPEMQYSSDGSSNYVGPDNIPFMIEDHEHQHCPCKEDLAEVADSSNTDQSSGEVMDLTDSDNMYNTILTTMAFMAFGTYIINMIMKINEKNSAATLMVVENGGNVENGRKLENVNDEIYLNNLMKQVMLFIEEFHELILEQL